MGGYQGENTGRVWAQVEVSFQVESPTRLLVNCMFPFCSLIWVPKEVSFATLPVSGFILRAKELKLDSELKSLP